MLTISIVALLSVTPSTAALSVTNVQVAGCAQTVLAENGLSEGDARMIHAGTSIRIGERITTFGRGDTIWRLCEASIETMLRKREVARMRMRNMLHPFQQTFPVRHNSVHALHQMG